MQKTGTVRHSFMLGHPNYVSLIIISTYLAHTYLIYDDKKDKIQYIVRNNINGIIMIYN